MKVKDLIETLQNGYKETDDICVLWWDKSCVTDDEDFPDERWEIICDEFEEWDDAGVDINYWLASAVCDYYREEEEDEEDE